MNLQNLSLKSLATGCLALAAWTAAADQLDVGGEAPAPASEVDDGLGTENLTEGHDQAFAASGGQLAEPGVADELGATDDRTLPEHLQHGHLAVGKLRHDPVVDHAARGDVDDDGHGESVVFGCYISMVPLLTLDDGARLLTQCRRDPRRDAR